MNWPEELIPEEFILQRIALDEGCPVMPIFDPPTDQIWHSEKGVDWKWSKQSKIYQIEGKREHFEELGSFWKQNGKRIWITVHDFLQETPSKIWVLLESDVAGMVGNDWLRSDVFLGHDSFFFLSEDGTHFGSLGGAMSENAFLMNQQMIKASISFEWPDWALLIFKRHSDFSWIEMIQDYTKDQRWSFYCFCSDYWSHFVLDQWAYGSDENVARVLETMYQLDAMDRNNDQWITVWDDLAIAFYSDNPPKWVDRMWHFMDPLTLIPDMVTDEGLEILRRKALQRNSKKSRKEEKRKKGRKNETEEGDDGESYSSYWLGEQLV